METSNRKTQKSLEIVDEIERNCGRISEGIKPKTRG
jgi:hypothetical protein